jgi:hypothetical protein
MQNERGGEKRYGSSLHVLEDMGGEKINSKIRKFPFLPLQVAKEEMCKQRDGMFHVKVLGQKEIVVITRPPSAGHEDPQAGTRQELTAV